MIVYVPEAFTVFWFERYSYLTEYFSFFFPFFQPPTISNVTSGHVAAFQLYFVFPSFLVLTPFLNVLSLLYWNLYVSGHCRHVGAYRDLCARPGRLDRTGIIQRRIIPRFTAALRDIPVFVYGARHKHQRHEFCFCRICRERGNTGQCHRHSKNDCRSPYDDLDIMNLV